MEELLYFTELLGLKVYDLRGRRIGRVADAALVPLIDPSRVDRYLVGGGWAWLTIRYDQIRTVTLDGIHLQDERLTPYHEDEYMLRIGRDLLDQQIVDVDGRKVVRVNDVTFLIRQEAGVTVLRILEVDVGLRSVLRRLFQGVLPRRWIRGLQSPIAPNSIRWEHCNIIEPDPLRRLRLNISYAMLEKLHPADLADIVEELGPEERESIFAAIDSEVAAEALSEVDPKMQASKRWKRRKPPRSSRRWPRTRPPTCWPSWRRKLRKKFSRRWMPSPRPRSGSCSSSPSTRRAA